MASCPECEFDEIDTADHEEGDELSCPECGKNLVLSGPDQLDFADDEDDLDDDDDDEEEEDDDDDAVATDEVVDDDDPDREDE